MTWQSGWVEIAVPASGALSWEHQENGKTLSLQALRKFVAAAGARSNADLLLQLMAAELHEGDLEEVVRIGTMHSPGQSGDWDELLIAALHMLDRYDEALERVDAALQLGDNPDMRSRRIEMLVELGRQDEAIAELNAMSTFPLAIRSKAVLELAIQEWGIDRVIALLDQWPPERSPAKRIELKLHCLLRMERDGEAAAIVDLGKYLSETFPSAPDGWDSSDFVASLRQEARGLKNLMRDPPRYSTSGGLRTFRVLEDQPRALVALHDLIRREVEAYTRALAPEDPLAVSRPERLLLDSWIILHERGGYQSPHIHPAGWLSGVFYISTADDADASGTLRIGLPPSPGEVVPWDYRTITPMPGKLLLFPSYFRHDTLAYGGTDPRICCAFDIYAA